PSSKSQPRPAQAPRQPYALTASPRPTVPAMNPTANSTVNTPIAGPSRRVNHLPTRDMLTSDSAPWPKPRTSTNVRNNFAAVDATLIPKTANPNPPATPTSTDRAPKRSIQRPTGRHKAEPIKTAQKLRPLKTTSSTPRVASSVNGLVIMPRPCVRPGRVALIAVAATTTLTQP